MDTIKVTTMEDSAFQLLGYIDYNGAAAVQSDISSITYKVFDKDDLTTEFTSGSLTVSSVIFDTLRTDARWTKDTTGYNFLHSVAYTVLPTSGKSYYFEYTVTWSAGGQNILRPVYEVYVKPAYSS